MNLTFKKQSGFYTVDPSRIRSRLDLNGDKENPFNESHELLRHYTNEMEELKNTFEGEQSSITLQKNKVKQILKQVRALKEKIPESHLPKSNDSIFGGYMSKWIEMLHPENQEYKKVNWFFFISKIKKKDNN